MAIQNISIKQLQNDISGKRPDIDEMRQQLAVVEDKHSLYVWLVVKLAPVRIVLLA